MVNTETTPAPSSTPRDDADARRSTAKPPRAASVRERLFEAAEAGRLPWEDATFLANGAEQLVNVEQAIADMQGQMSSADLALDAIECDPGLAGLGLEPDDRLPLSTRIARVHAALRRATERAWAVEELSAHAADLANVEETVSEVRSWLSAKRQAITK